MLQTALLVEPPTPSNYSLRVRRKSNEIDIDSSDDQQPPPVDRIEIMADNDGEDDDDGSLGGNSAGDAKERSKSRRELPTGAVATLKAWLLSPEHFTHPYPTPQDQAMLMQKTGIDKKQLKNWFTNARRRIWKPMLKKQIEQGKLTATGAPGGPGGLIIPTMPGAPSSSNTGLENPHSVQAMRLHYQQVVQQQQQEQQQQQHVQQQQQQHQQQQVLTQSAQVDIFGNNLFSSAQQTEQSIVPQTNQYYISQPDNNTSTQQQQLQSHLTATSSIGTLQTLSSCVNLSKTDSHAVLMELFARDQDLVRQATESARLKAEARQLAAANDNSNQLQLQQQQQQHSQIQESLSSQPQQQQQLQQQSALNQHPMKVQSSNGSGGGIPNVPTLNSWPHFSSISSLNNLGTIPGVKSITSMSGADLVAKGGANRMGNLAQVKSMESMGRNDSYAFLEVFFGDRSSTNLMGMGGKDQRSMKTSGDEDNEIGLSLEDESPSHPISCRKDFALALQSSSLVQSASMLGLPLDSNMMLESGTLKRAYDDALAARGLMAVSRSSEKLTDLILPAKLQRTLSQEFISKQQLQKQQQQQQQQAQQIPFGQFKYTSAPASANLSEQGVFSSQQQDPGEHSIEPSNSDIDTSETDGHVKVPMTTVCALCQQPNVDTQLRPCGHMFHERCLKPSLQTPVGQPKCPVDNIPMQFAMLAIPTCDEGSHQQQQQQGLETPGSRLAPASSSWSYSLNQQHVSAADNESV